MSHLSLDDPRWADLQCRGGSASHVPSQLQHLLDHPGDSAAFANLWPELCSEGTTWPAAFAAAPYIVQIASMLPPGKRLDHLAVLGLARMGEPETEIPCHLVAAYDSTHRTALALIGSELVFEHGPENTRLLLAAAAAMKGYPGIGEAIEAMDLPVAKQLIDNIEK